MKKNELNTFLAHAYFVRFRARKTDSVVRVLSINYFFTVL